MTEQQKVPLMLATASGSEPVREWLKDLAAVDRKAVGQDLMRAQWRWPVGMPLCRPMGKGLWEIRRGLSSHRIARVLMCVYEGQLVAPSGRTVPAFAGTCVFTTGNLTAAATATTISGRELATAS